MEQNKPPKLTLVPSCLNTCSQPGFPCASLFDILDAMRDFCRRLRQVDKSGNSIEEK